MLKVWRTSRHDERANERILHEGIPYFEEMEEGISLHNIKCIAKNDDRNHKDTNGQNVKHMHLPLILQIGNKFTN